MDLRGQDVTSCFQVEDREPGLDPGALVIAPNGDGRGRLRSDFPVGHVEAEHFLSVEVEHHAVVAQEGSGQLNLGALVVGRNDQFATEVVGELGRLAGPDGLLRAQLLSQLGAVAGNRSG